MKNIEIKKSNRIRKLIRNEIYWYMQNSTAEKLEMFLYLVSCELQLDCKKLFEEYEKRQKYD